MVNKKFWHGILVIVLVFGMTVVGCDNNPDNDNGNGNEGTGDGGGKTDSALNGTWVFDFNNLSELKILSGNYENSDDGGTTIHTKGTYTTNNGRWTQTPTYWNGSKLPSSYGLDSKWYSKNELESALKEKKNQSGLTDEQITNIVNSYYNTSSSNYSINGNKLTFTHDNGTTTILTKK